MIHYSNLKTVQNYSEQLDDNEEKSMVVVTTKKEREHNRGLRKRQKCVLGREFLIKFNRIFN